MVSHGVSRGLSAIAGGACFLLAACGSARESADAADTGAALLDSAAVIDAPIAPATDAPPDLTGARVDVAPDAPVAMDALPSSPPTLADLQGGWSAEPARVDGGGWAHRRRRFVDRTYYEQRSGTAGAQCAEVGSFELGANGIAFTPARVAGPSICKLGQTRTEPVRWSEIGIAFESDGVVQRYARIPAVPKLFPTAEAHDGNFAADAALAGATAIAKADAFCNASLSRPDGLAYRALLVDGVSRSAVPAIDWVFRPSTTYFAVDGVVNVLRTHADGLANPSVNNPSDPDAYAYQWTGLTFDFTTSRSNCRGWTSNVTPDVGAVSQAGVPQFALASSVGVPCDYPSGLVCVSQ